MGNHLEAPKTDKSSQEHVTGEGLIGGATEMQGWRFEMEDAHILTDFPPERLNNGGVHSLLAVFDGHGGAGAAKYASIHLMSHIESTTEWQNYVKDGCKDPHLIGLCLHKAFLELDAALRVSQDKERETALLNYKNTSSNSFPESNEQPDTSGSTIVVCVITPKYIICGNAGDSRCVMGTNGTTKELSDDHKPANEGERNRIMRAGGYVAQNRVEGNLAVSRALGDFEFKDVGKHPEETKVTAAPDIVVHERTPSDDCLILACDGVWDVFKSSEAVDLCREIYSWGESNMRLMCEELVDTALERGSKDNISCVALRLPGAIIGDTSLGGVEGKRIERQQMQDRLRDLEMKSNQAVGRTDG